MKKSLTFREFEPALWTLCDSNVRPLSHPGPQMKVQPELILFIHNWISDRHFRVHYRRAISTMYPLKNGIPQGSSLSVLLWLIFINDLGEELDPNSTNLFVDDTLIWSTANSRALLYGDLSAKALIVNAWPLAILSKLTGIKPSLHTHPTTTAIRKFGWLTTHASHKVFLNTLG